MANLNLTHFNTSDESITTVFEHLVEMNGFDNVNNAFDEFKRRKRLDQLNQVLRLVICADWFSIRIFGYLSIGDIKNLDIAFSNHSIRSLWLSCPKHFTKKKMILSEAKKMDWCASRNVLLDDVEISSYEETVTDERILRLATQCQFLKHFKLHCAKAISDHGFLNFIRKCPNLETIVLSSSTVISDISLAVIGTYCKQLVNVEIKFCKQITAAGIEALLKNCQLLKTFQLSSFYDENCDAFPTFKIFRNLGKYCPLLESLYLEGVTLSCKKNILILDSSYKLLKTIILGNVNCVTDDFLNIIGTNCHILEAIQLPPEGEFSDRGVLSVLQGCPLLKSFKNLSRVPMITDAAFTNISRHCPVLERISFGCTTISDVTLKELGKLPMLKCLCLFNFAYNNITDDGIEALVSKQYNHNHNNITNDDKYPLLSSSSSSSSSSVLQCLQLYTAADRVTSTSIYTIANNCPQLKSIFIYDCHNKVPSDALRHLVNACPQLVLVSGTATLGDNLKKKLRKRRKEVMAEVAAATICNDSSSNDIPICMASTLQN